MKEIFKPVKGYEGLYSVSNLGRIRSEAKEWITGKGTKRKKGVTFLKEGYNTCKYLQIVLCKNGKRKTFRIAHLVWDHFGSEKRNGRKLQVDHINNIKEDNRICNLQLLTQRENSTKKNLRNKTSKHIGVYWHKKDKK
jgi:hypothetical protein